MLFVSFRPQDSFSSYLLTLYSKNSVTIATDPLMVIAWFVLVACLVAMVYGAMRVDVWCHLYLLLLLHQPKVTHDSCGGRGGTKYEIENMRLTFHSPLYGAQQRLTRLQ